MDDDVGDMVVILPKSNRPEIKPLTNDEIMIILDKIRGSQYKSIITAAIFTGMRESELLGLKWCDVDFRACTIKNDKPRSICPAPFIISILKHDFERRKDIDREGFVFVNEHGEHFSHNAVYRFFKKIARECLNRNDLRFHDLRHTYAVLSLQAGDDYKTLSETMGHYSAAFTLDRYGHCTDNMKNISSQRMEDYYQNVLVGKEKPQAIKITI